MSRSYAESSPTLILSCPVCASDAADTLGVTGSFADRAGASVVMKCLECTTIYLSPAPVGSPGLQRGTPATVVTRRSIDRCVRGLPRTARILCFDSEIEERLSSLSRNGSLDWSVDRTDAEFRSAGSGGYDLIVLTQVLESACDPGRVLQQAAALLAPGGGLAAIVHNAGSAVFGIFGGRHWNGYRFPATRQQLAAGSLGALARQAGLRLTGHDTFFHPTAWLESTRNWLQDWGASAGAIRLLAGSWLLPRATAFLLEAVATMRGRGSMLVARIERQ